jgi:small redox-active disulfide protein 2
MGLFGSRKKKNGEEELVQCDCGGACKPSEIAAKKAAEEKTASSGCCCGGNCNAETMAQAEKAKCCGPAVKVLGSGCAKCNQLEAATKEALLELGMDTTIDHVTDFSQIAAYGVMTTPALVVDGRVVSFGKVLKKDEVKAILSKVRG